MTFLYELINLLVVFSILYIVLIYLKLDILDFKPVRKVPT
jgi:hypothetical protein